MRVLLYARYSADLQDPLSIDTQLTMCRRELAQTEVPRHPPCHTQEGEVGTLHIGMGTINADQIAATSLKTRDALIKRHAMGKNPGGTAYGYEKLIAYDLNGER